MERLAPRLCHADMFAGRNRRRHLACFTLRRLCRGVAEAGRDGIRSRRIRRGPAGRDSSGGRCRTAGTQVVSLRGIRDSRHRAGHRGVGAEIHAGAERIVLGVRFAQRGLYARRPTDDREIEELQARHAPVRSRFPFLEWVGEQVPQEQNED